MRCFLALEFDESTRARVRQLQDELKQMDVDATYPKPEQLHVTLCFLGEITEENAQSKIEALHSFSFPSFPAALQGIGFFPSPSFVRVVWIGFSQGKQKVMRLQQEVAELLQHKERERFEPHVTLARIRTPKSKERLAEFAQRYADFAVGFEANTLTLYQSRLSPKGPEYHALFQKTLDK